MLLYTQFSTRMKLENPLETQLNCLKLTKINPIIYYSLIKRPHNKIESLASRQGLACVMGGDYPNSLHCIFHCNINRVLFVLKFNLNGN